MDPQENDHVANVLGGLKRINAPDNFESGVRARIVARHAPRPSWTPVFFKLALPAGGLAMIALVLYFSGFLMGNIEPLKVEKDGSNPSFHQELPNEQPREYTAHADENNNVPQEGNIPDATVAKVNEANSRRQSKRKTLANSGSNDMQISVNRAGSFDSAINAIDNLPKDFNTNQSQKDPGKPPVRPSVPINQFLVYTGVQTENRANELFVSSVVQDSFAQKIGVKSGDVVEALNDVKVTPLSAFPSGVNLRSIRVRRDGRSIDLKR